MDVHYHPHLKHESKPLREHILEFLLIFFAVTLGFFAENLREYFVDKNKTKEYAQSLYDDLKVDTLVIQRTLNEKIWIKAKYDSAENILSSAELYKYNEFIYYVERYLAFNDVFTTQDITYQQLRNSGNFRYIKNIDLYKKIAEYYNLYKRYESVDGSLGSEEKRNKLTGIESKLFNPHDLTSLDNDSAESFYKLAFRPVTKLKTIRWDAESLKLLYLQIADAKERTGGVIKFLQWLKFDAINLMKDLKKEYNLK